MAVLRRDLLRGLDNYYELGVRPYRLTNYTVAHPTGATGFIDEF